MSSKWMELLEKAAVTWREESELLRNPGELRGIIENLEGVVERATFLARYLDLRDVGVRHARAVKRANRAKAPTRSGPRIRHGLPWGSIPIREWASAYDR
jgi:hypothetical protein